LTILVSLLELGEFFLYKESPNLSCNVDKLIRTLFLFQNIFSSSETKCSRYRGSSGEIK